MPTDTLLSFKCTPIGSVLTLEPAQRSPYFEKLLAASGPIQNLVISARTGAYLMGLVKTNDLPLESTPQLSLHILKIAFGEEPLPQLRTKLATEFNLDSAKAGKMAEDIERELFSTITLELNQQRMIAAKMPPQPPIPPAGGARNVLDLKNQPRPPQPLPSRQ